MGNILHAEPIYGSGWIGEGETSREVPLAMEIKVEQQTSNEWQGYVTSTQHEFYGAQVLISKRYNDDDDYVNIRVLSTRYPHARLAAGYARLLRVNDT